MSTADCNQVQLPWEQRDNNNNNQYRGRGDVYGRNWNNYRGRNYNNRSNRNNGFYRQNNTFYHQNFQQHYNGSDSGPPRPARGRFNSNQRTNHSQTGQQLQQQQGRGRRQRPRQLRLNDFMPPQLRDNSPANVRNLPRNFDLANSDYTGTTNTRSTTPNDVFTQQSRAFTTQTVTTNNTTQPFNVNENFNVEDTEPGLPQRENNQQQQQRRQPIASTTTSYRRRKRRIRQQQHHNEHDNRFAELAETDNETKYSDDINEAAHSTDHVTNDDTNNKKKTEQKAKKKKRNQQIYLDPARIMRYLQDNATNIIGARGNQAYALATTSIYDQWVRDNYDMQVWQHYLNMGTQDKHWAKEVIKRTKKRDDVINTRFVQKKINQFTTNIAQANANISNLQIQLGTYWSQTLSGTTLATTMATAATTNPNTNRIRESTERLEKIILKYVQHCTQHVKKQAEQRIQLAKAELAEYRALRNFEELATPTQWSMHSMLKPKVKQWSTKNKNYEIATKRVEYDLPSSFISKIDLTFKIDESILSKEEAQGLYNDMRQMIKECRTQAMILHLRSITREREILSNEIRNIIAGFPRENSDEFDHESSYIAFKQYHDLRGNRLELEAEQACYFLVEERVEGDINEEEVVAPTLTRSLGEDFSLQL